MRVLKFDGHKVHLWSGRFQTFLTGRGSSNALESTSDPMRIAGSLGGMAEHDRLIYPHGQERAEHGVSDGSERACRRTHVCHWVSKGSIEGCDGYVSIAECTPRLLRVVPLFTKMSVQKPPYLFGARLDLDPADVVDVLPATIHRLHTFHVRQLDPAVMLPIHMMYIYTKRAHKTHERE